MGYELCLRRKAPDQPLPDGAAITAALQAAGATGAEGALQFAAGGAKVPARLARKDGELQGVDLEIPFGAPDDDFRAAVLLGTLLSTQLNMSLMDPQLGGELTPARAEDAVGSWRTATKYAVDTAGIVEDARNMAPVEPPPPVIGPRGKAMLIVLGVLVVAYLLLSWVVGDLIQAPVRPID
ncbi:MAG: hypothetical protein JST54_18125 [Deltaproteobacteria bacterium]|nr:hypothetical protein [Deltaproteobacteria bacterium]